MTRKVRKTCPLCQHDDRDGLESDILSVNITCEDLDKQEGWWAGTSKKHMQNHIDNYNAGSNPSCALCTNPNRAELEVRIREGSLTPTDASEILSCSLDQIQLHLRKHLQPLVQSSAALDIVRMDLNEVDILGSNVEVLRDKVQELLDNTTLSNRQIDSLTKLAKEIRESLKYLLEFKGQLVHKREETVIIQQVEIIQKVLIEKYPEIWTEIRDDVAGVLK
mgnify:FL=1